MAKNIDEALNNVEMTYSQVVEVANDMLKDIFDPINSYVATISEDINSCSVDEIREYIIRLQLKAYELSEIKEKSALKAELAEALQKEKFAVTVTGADGAATLRDKVALIATSEEIVVQCLYELVANLLKTKQDQLHRLVDSCKSILMSRMQEAKLNIGGLE